MTSPLGRIAYCAKQWAILIDEGAQILIRSAIYIPTGTNPPSAHETISGWVGASAEAGRRWARVARVLIDGVFGKGHCAAQAAYEASVDTPV